MKYRRLGRSALMISELCLGTMNFGSRSNERESHEILGRAVDAGINFIDTANQYGGDLGVGATESILGKWLAKNKSCRDNLIIASKVHEPMSGDINDRGLSARHIQKACENSLKRLGVDHIDLYQMHHFDRNAPIEEIWQAMENLISQGKITYVGSSNFPGWAIARANEKALSRQRLGLVSEQSLYNLTERRVEMEVLPACREYGLGLLPWSPLAGGQLSGRRGGSSGRRESAAMGEAADRINQFHAYCENLNESPAVVALAWLLTRPGVAAVIVGPGSAAHLSAVLGVPDVVLDEAALLRIDEIFPPCGEAPEAYAW